MKVINTKFRGLKIIKGITHYDKRGCFRETFKNTLFKNKSFIFWCMSLSRKNVIRGLHLQKKFQQEKFVSVVKGKIFDVVLDLRKKSKTYKKQFSIILSDKNSTSLLIPAGFAHGFCGLEKDNLVFYGCTNYRSAKDEVGILWNDKSLKIKWPIKKPIVSSKDNNNITFKTYNKLYL
jgi:dTDP-4-dehydrorhamnose 3,5-epimerase|tara:strand:+ start:678 stop:1208 length:531 start_codon:yes stop_codon:yes gene_type:complete